MAVATESLTKRVAIDKTNTQTVATVAVAAFITVFSLVAIHAVWELNSYQARLTSAKEKAHRQLITNINNYGKLSLSYQSFISAQTNVIGGQANATGNNNGSNAQIILDALPPSYDYPALNSSIEKILNDRGLKISSISGTDDQLNQQNNTSSNNPQPVPMPFSFTVEGVNYSQVSQLVTALQQSIRPIVVDTIDLSGGSSDMTLTVSAHTYYQPGKTVSITNQVVK